MSILLLILGFILLVVGGIMMLVAAFRTSLGWFLAYLFLPFGSLIFLIVHWAEAKVSFLLQVAGVLLIVPYALTSDAWKLAVNEGLKTYHSRMGQSGAMGATDEAKSDRPPAQSNKIPTGSTTGPTNGKPSSTGTLSAVALAAEAETQRNQAVALKRSVLEAHAAQLRSRYEGLQARRAELKPDDTAALLQFNTDAAEYQAQRKSLELEKAAFEAAQPAR